MTANEREDEMPLPPNLPNVNLPKAVLRESPNQSARTHGNDSVDLIIVHTPEGGYAGAIATCLNPVADVSYHLLIREDGLEATQLVKWHQKAWHAKVHNSRSEGISLAGFASSTKALSPVGRAGARVVAARLLARGLPPTWRKHGEVGGGFCRHADLQTDRQDPMSLSRWRTFVALVKHEYERDAYRDRWGFGEPDEIPGV